MADFYGGFGGTKAALEDSDLQEEEVWAAIMKANEISSSTSTSNSSSKTRKKFSPLGSSSSAISPQAIPRSSTNQDSTTDWFAQHSSAPMGIPDWSKIMKSNKKSWDDSCEYSNSNHDDDGDDDDIRNKRHHFKLDYGDDDDDDDKMVPPHEYLAKKLASTQIASYSMCEGVGRTLKGRDLSKLRNAILTKTGFLE